jgi:hypothetical protein
VGNLGCCKIHQFGLLFIVALHYTSLSMPIEELTNEDFESLKIPCLNQIN